MAPFCPDLLPEVLGGLPVFLGLAEVLLIVAAVDIESGLMAKEPVLTFNPLPVFLFMDPSFGSNDVAVHGAQNIVIAPLGVFPPGKWAGGVLACPCAAVPLVGPLAPALISWAVVNLGYQLSPCALDL